MKSGQYLHYSHKIRGDWDVHFKNYTAVLSGESKQASSCRKATQCLPCTSNQCIVGFIVRGLYLDGQTLQHSHPLVLGKIGETDGSYREMSEKDAARDIFTRWMLPSLTGHMRCPEV